MSPLRLRLDRAALAANWRAFAAAAGPAATGAAVKADGYGLGAPEVVRILAAAGCREFFVATWAEAAALGALPSGTAVAVLHGVQPGEEAAARASLARPVLNSAAQVARWRAMGGGPCDVMVDTGMNRLGLPPAEAVSGLLAGLALETLHSHLACADTPDHPLNERQRAAFADVVAAVRPPRAALANSAGVCLGPAFAFDLVRPGLGLYGGGPAPGPAPLAPVAALAGRVVQRRHVAAGASIGYGATFTAARDTEVAVVNLGYADGYPRALAGHGHARAGDRRFPLLGRVSMDLTAFDVGDADVAEGDWLTLAFDLAATAAAAHRSQYELLTGLGHRYERVWR